LLISRHQPGELRSLANDADLDHAVNVIDGECQTGKSFGGPGDGDVHDESLLSVPQA